MSNANTAQRVFTERRSQVTGVDKASAAPAGARLNLGFQLVGIGVSSFAVLVLLSLLGSVLIDALPRLTPAFFTSYPSRFAEKAGILSPLVGTLLLMLLTAAVSFPLGVGAALYLEEYARRGRLTRLIELNVASLAGVPSIIYGLLGLEILVRWFGLGRSLISGALTLALLVMPIIILSAQEAIRRVPQSLREGAYALGATRWEVVRDHVLPVSMPGILTGCILAFSRAIGETAPLVTMGALTYVAFLPDSLSSPFSALPIQAFNWLSRPQSAFHSNAAAAIVVLLALLLSLNALAIALRLRYERRTKW